MVWLGGLSVSGAALADGQGSAEVVAPAACMQELYAANGGKGTLGCTSNDVRVAGVAMREDGITPDIVFLDADGNETNVGCRFPGDTITFRATFDVVLSAQERHDIGIYFAVDGDDNGDGALSSDADAVVNVDGVQKPAGCIVATPAYGPLGEYMDLDGLNDDPNGILQDQCGDIDYTVSPLKATVVVTTTCNDPDQNGKLNLPICTSWRQPGANELCLSPTDAYPGSPSKCNCDQGFEIDVDVPDGTIEVTKVAAPTEVSEPGGNVTFTVTTKNPSIDPALTVTISSMLDDIYGDITTTHGGDTDGRGEVTATTCVLGTVIAANNEYTCQFTGYVPGNPGSGIDTETDTVTVKAWNNRAIPRELEAFDSATVAILDVLPSIDVTKDASVSSLEEPGGPVTFTVTVYNTSTASSDPVTITSLTDKVGDTTLSLDGKGSCSLPQTIQPGGYYTCSFEADVTGNAGDAQTDTVTAAGTDDESNPVSDTASKTVSITNVGSAITVTKTADPSEVSEPGKDVTFTVMVANASPVDTVYIDSLTDNVYGVITNSSNTAIKSTTCGGLPWTLGVGASRTCSFTAYVGTDRVAVGETETDTVTASGKDDDGETVSDSGSANVTVNDVKPSATLTKTATAALVTYEVTVKNESVSSDPLVLSELTDTTFGDLTYLHGAVERTDCELGTIDPGATYSCTFDARVTSSPHINTVTGALSDDEGNAVTPSDSATVELK